MLILDSSSFTSSICSRYARQFADFSTKQERIYRTRSHIDGFNYLTWHRMHSRRKSLCHGRNSKMHFVHVTNLNDQSVHTGCPATIIRSIIAKESQTSRTLELFLANSYCHPVSNFSLCIDKRMSVIFQRGLINNKMIKFLLIIKVILSIYL